MLHPSDSPIAVTGHYPGSRCFLLDLQASTQMHLPAFPETTMDTAPIFFQSWNGLVELDSFPSLLFPSTFAQTTLLLELGLLFGDIFGRYLSLVLILFLYSSSLLVPFAHLENLMGSQVQGSRGRRTSVWVGTLGTTYSVVLWRWWSEVQSTKACRSDFSRATHR